MSNSQSAQNPRPNSARWKVVVLATLGVIAVVVIGLLGVRAATKRSSSPDEGAVDPVPTSDSTPAAFGPGEQVRMLIVGDSISVGWFASEEATSFTSILISELENEFELESTFVGAVGFTSRDLAPLVPDESYDLVIVEAGTNDLAFLPPPDFEADYARLINEVRASSPQAQLLCTGPWAPSTVAGEYDRATERLCSDAGGQYVSFSEIYDDDSTHGPEGQATSFGFSDDFHPNDSGHEAIASQLKAEIRIAQP